MTLITLLNPVAPHMTEELWEKYGNGGFLSMHRGRHMMMKKTVDDEVEIVIRLTEKIKDKMMIAAGLDKDGILNAAMESEKIKSLTDRKNYR